MVHEFLDLGMQPLANGFRDPNDPSEEYRHPLRVGADDETYLISLIDPVPKEKMFNQAYPFLTGSSEKMKDYFARMALNISAFCNSKNKNKRKNVMEIGCNDGTFLTALDDDINKIGIEPCENIAEVCAEKGIEVYPEYFTRDLANRIVTKHGKFLAIYAANTICHIEDLDEVFEAVKILLDPEGQFVFEDPWFGAILAKGTYDQIYDEHIHYFTVLAVERLAKKHGLKLYSALPTQVHGGGMRYYIYFPEHVGEEYDYSVTTMKALEHTLGVYDMKELKRFASRVYTNISLFKELVQAVKKPIWAYGATSKSTVIYNACGIGNDKIKYVTDTTPYKIGKLLPGTKIPIIHPDERSDEDTVAFLAAWNHKEEIFKKEKSWIESGGRFITHLLI